MIVEFYITELHPFELIQNHLLHQFLAEEKASLSLNPVRIDSECFVENTVEIV